MDISRYFVAFSKNTTRAKTRQGDRLTCLFRPKDRYTFLPLFSAKVYSDDHGCHTEKCKGTFLPSCSLVLAFSCNKKRVCLPKMAAYARRIDLFIKSSYPLFFPCLFASCIIRRVLKTHKQSKKTTQPLNETPNGYPPLSSRNSFRLPLT